MGKTALAIFIRFPQPGQVKSRLARKLGAEEAATFYRLCAEKIVIEASKVPGDVEIFLSLSDIKDRDAVKKWLGSQFSLMAQEEGDLGYRLKQTFHTFLDGKFSKAIIIASDAPDLTKNTIVSAVSLLDGHDLVIGPCNDGGYYLIGLKKKHGELFGDIDWGTDRVLEQTLKIAVEKGLKVGKTDLLMDIDTLDDLIAWVNYSKLSGDAVWEYGRTLLMARG